MSALSSKAAISFVLSAGLLNSAAQPASNARRFQPEDLFRIRQLGAVNWSSNGLNVAFELVDASQTLDSALPTSDILLLNTKSHAIRTLIRKREPYVGFFDPVWSPDGRRWAFLSVDRNAHVQLWMWISGAQAPTLVRDLDVHVSFLDTPIAWIDRDRIAVLIWEKTAQKSSDLAFRVLRGSNVAEGWKRVRAAREATASVMESRESKFGRSAGLAICSA